jgi:hypothetical protein
MPDLIQSPSIGEWNDWTLAGIQFLILIRLACLSLPISARHAVIATKSAPTKHWRLMR